MQISLPSDLERFVDEKVSQGEYANASEVVSEALSIWRQQTALTPEDIEELRREIMIGVEEIERGECGEWNAEEIKSEGRRLLRERPRPT